jgi:hypothetical protein
MLRNAFDNLSTESALRRIVNLLNFARDAQDRVRVTLDTNNATNLVYNRNSSSSMHALGSELYFGGSSWNAMDARMPVIQQFKAMSDIVKRNRWTY